MFFFQAEDGIRDLVRSRGLGDVYKRQAVGGTPVGGTAVGGTAVGGTPVGGTAVGGTAQILPDPLGVHLVQDPASEQSASVEHPDPHAGVWQDLPDPLAFGRHLLQVPAIVLHLAGSELQSSPQTGGA